jgi:ParB family chromosome partitioning protein
MTPIKGLGRGLGALLGEENLRDAEGKLHSLRINEIEPGNSQPRQFFNPETLQELADSIRRHGLIQPLVVRRLPTGFCQIIAGERRWRAARIAGLKEVPVLILEADDIRAHEIALIENLQREDLTPLEEAEGYEKLMNAYGLTQEDVAERVGRSRPAVANALRLLSLSETLRLMITSGQLTAGHARALLGLSDSSEQLKLANRVAAEGLSVRQTEEAVASWRKQSELADKAGSANAGNAVDYAADLSLRLTRQFGRKVRIVQGRRQGRIELFYHGDQDLEALLETLGGRA